MRTSTLGTDGTTVTAVGSGDISLPRSYARGVDARELAHAVHSAIDRGLTVIEATPDDDSERLVGDTLRTLRARDRVTTITRVPPLAPPIGVTSSRLDVRLPADYVQKRVEASLRATRLDVLPLVLLPHRVAWVDAIGWDELRGTCAQLVHDGKVLRWGAIIDERGVDRDDDDRVAGLTDDFAAVMVTYNACDRLSARVIAGAAAKKLAVFVRQPLAGGTLAGTLGPGVTLSPADDRGVLTDEQLTTIAEVTGALAALVRHVPPAAESCKTARARLAVALTRRPDIVEAMTLAELSLRFAMDEPGVTAVLPRMSRAVEDDDAVMAASVLPLSPEVRARLAAEITELLAVPAE